MNTSYVVYEGPSAFDSKLIIGVVTGLVRPTRNPKTGHMAQLWILRADVHPFEALQTRKDYSICGDCPLRGDGSERACYVTMNAPGQVYQAYKRGDYEIVDPEWVGDILKGKDLPVRLGAYGEPTALPFYVSRDLIKGVGRWTGYTHQWRHCQQRFNQILMASVDSQEQAEHAQALGWRTFRVRTGTEPLMSREIVCPASAEAGHRTTCERCKLCQGAGLRAKSIAIMPHGVNAPKFVELRRVS